MQFSEDLKCLRCQVGNAFAARSETPSLPGLKRLRCQVGNALFAGSETLFGRAGHRLSTELELPSERWGTSFQRSGASFRIGWWSELSAEPKFSYQVEKFPSAGTRISFFRPDRESLPKI